jgi:hypothetical protein
MSDSFLHQVVSAVVAGVLAATGGGVRGEDDRSAPGDEVGSRPAAPAPAPEPSGRSRPDSPAVSGDRSVGRDISWPNCPTGLGIPARRTLGLPLPPRSARFAVVGLTNGPGFHPNPCLTDQVARLRRQRLWTAAYAVVTYPTRGQLRRYGAAGPRSDGDRAGRLFNTGYAQARLNLATMQAAGLSSPVVWLDVEPVTEPAPWSGDVLANRTVLEGSMTAYRDAGLRLGVYSTPYLWRSVVGDVRYRLPEWRTAGLTSRAAAERRCAGPAIQGGRPVLAQWADARVDYDVLCPGRPERDLLADWFVAP